MREILKLQLDVNLSNRIIAKQLGVGETSVRDTLKRLQREGLTWPVQDMISDSEP
nr:Lrp/AsnC family transcriptional regulator [Mesorhizobium sp. WSM3879]